MSPPQLGDYQHINLGRHQDPDKASGRHTGKLLEMRAAYQALVLKTTKTAYAKLGTCSTAYSHGCTKQLISIDL
jgi:hypothetical protein